MSDSEESEIDPNDPLYDQLIIARNKKRIEKTQKKWDKVIDTA